MKIDQYISHLRNNKNIIIGVDNGELKLNANKNDLTEEIIREIKSRKLEIISFFESFQGGNGNIVIPQAEEKEHYVLSPAQRRMFLTQELDKTSTAYNLPIIANIEGPLETEKVQTIFKDLIIRHEAFRTSFHVVKGEIFQQIHSSDEIDFEINHFTSDQNGVPKIIEDFIQPFDLSAAPLIRVGLIEISPSEFVLIVDMHHIISDGVSNALLVREFMDAYHGQELASLKINYKDYAEWMASEEQQKRVSKQKNFWLQEYADLPESLHMPTDFDRPQERDYTSDIVELELDAKEAKALKSLAEKSNATPFMMFLSIYHILMSKLSGQEDIVIGVPTAGRQHADLERIIGVFINTVCLRNNADGQLNFKEFLANVKDRTLTCFDNQGYPYEELINELNLERDPSRNPLFDVMFTYQNQEYPDVKISDLTLSEYEGGHKVALFDIHLTIWELITGVLKLQFAYQTSLYKRETMERFVSYFKEILRIVSADVEVKLSDINLVPDSEKQLLLHDFNDTKVDYPADETVVSLFDAKANEVPNNVALHFGKEKMTYQELKESSDRFAVYLKEVHGIKKGDLVGLMMERELQLMPSIFGIMKAGAAYVPVSPDYPVDRKLTIMDGARLTALVSRGKYLEADLANTSVQLINLDETQAVIDQQEVGSFAPDITPDDLAYIIHTSGSTGVPKGVMIEHGSAVNRIQWMQGRYPLTEQDVLIQKTPLVFDVSVWELFWWSFNGASLVLLAPEGEKDPKQLIETINAHQVSVMHFVPSMLNVFLSVLNEDSFNKLKSLRQVFTSGEALRPDHVNQFREGVHKHTGSALTNLYGPTEATVDVSYFDCDLTKATSQVPIGKPVSNTQLYILDHYNHLSPLGSYGELCIGGVQVARGYLHQEELTNERFVNHPELGRIYHTGDLARRLPDGNIEYSGRIDTQVKVRGYRIELGEIEHQLLHLDGLKSAVVEVKHKGGDPYLVGYYVHEVGDEVEVDTLREHLLKTLPDYMVPNSFVRLDEIPLTISGKVNRRLLPEPEVTRGVEYVAPESEEEQQMAAIWSEILLVEEVGRMDNFFNSGGDSIKAIRLIYEIKEQLATTIDLSDLYTHQTLAELTSLLNEKQGQVDEALERAEAEVAAFAKKYEETVGSDPSFEAVYPMSGVEKGMVFYTMLKDDDEDDFHKILYHEQNIYPIYWADFDFDIFTAAVKLMMEKHEELRKVFDVDNFAHIIKKEMTPELNHWDIRHLSEEEQSRYILDMIEVERIKATDFSGKVPLWRMNLVQIKDTLRYIIFDMHHAVMDGWSLHAFLAELNDTCIHLAKDPNYKMDRLRSGYKEHIIGELRDTYNDSSKAYWQEELLEYNRFEFQPTGADHQYVTKFYELGPELKQDLENLATELGSSLKNLVFAAYLYTFRTLGGFEDYVTGFTANNRPLVPDGEKILGCFLNVVPYRAQIPQSGSWRDFISEVDQRLVSLKQHERIPLKEIVDIVDEVTTDQNPFFDIAFNFIDFWIIHERMTNESHTQTEDLDFGHDNRDVNQNTLLDFHVKATDDLLIHLEYSTTIVDAELADKLCEFFESTLKQFTLDVDQSISSRQIISEEETNRMLKDFNTTTKALSSVSSVLELFNEQVTQVPDSIALQYESGETMSYSALEDLSNQVSHFLQEVKGIKKGDLVGLMLERGPELVPFILGIMKLGAAYIPIDPEYPEERVKAIIAGSGINQLVGRPKYLSNKSVIPLINVDKVSSVLSTYSKEPVSVPVSSSDLAYVIYTSGSTGKPKGVMIEHGSLLNYVNWGSNHYLKGEEKSFALYSSISFDLTVTSIFIPLATGNKLVVYGEEQEGQGTLIGKVFMDNLSDVIKLTPSHLKVVKELITDPTKLDHKKLIVGGEQLTTTVASDIHQLLAGKVEIYNEYGPTESTVGCMIHQYEPGSTSTNVPIGLPIDNVRVYILDSNLNPVPIGVPGELYLGGAGLSRGYMGDDAQTATRFVSVESVGEARLYRTGDVSRWLSSGKMEYLGRVDDQVKLNGYRIELGEIERILATHEKIATAAVVMKYRGEEPYLAAYYESEQELETESLRQHLLDKLPSYMVPFHYVQLTQLPLTTNGKLDHKALPEPEVSQEAYEAPETQEEILLSEVWTAVLGGDNKGVTEDFFLVGGDSIRSIQISSRVRELGYELSIKDIFNHRTIREQAKVLKKLTRTSYQGEVTGSGEVTPIQHWFLTGHEGDKNHYHQSMLLNFKDGTTKEEVATIFKHLQQHHDALRTTFKETSGKWEATVAGYAQNLSIEEQDFRGSSDEQLSLLAAGEQLRKSIDITAGPLMKLGLYHLSDGSRLLLVVHHLVIDAVSWRIMFEDIHQLYSQYRSEETLQLPQKTDAFQLWTKYLEDYQQGFAYQKAKDYWQSLDTTAIHWELTDHTSGANRYADTAYAGFSLEPELTANLLGEAHSTYGTQVNDLLLASLLLALSKGYDHSNIQIDLEGHGREPLDQGEHMGRTVGWFTTIYPVVLRHEPGTNLGRLIKQVKESLHQVPHHGMDYLLQGQQEGDTASGSSILFNYLGQFDSDTSDRVYAISQEPSGSEVSHDAQRRHEWDVSGMVVGGELRLEISYSKERYESAKMTSFVALYKECLAEVVTHCSKQSNKELTPSDVTHPNLSIDELDVLQSKYDVADVYPLSPMQEGILYHTLSEPDSDSYFEQITYQVKGELSMDVVGASMQELVARHGVLRTLFQWEGFDRPLQVVQNAGQMEIEYEDIREEVAQGSIRSVIEEKQKLDRSRKFDLSEAVLMRFTIYRTADDEYTFIWSHHHIVLDGWCMGILVDEFNKIYAEKSTGEKQELPLPAPYASYITWLGEQDKAAGLNHWESYLAGYDGLASLPQKPAWSNTEQGYALNSVELTFDKAELQGLQQLSREYGVTTNTIFQMAWGLLLSRYNYTNDTVFGQVVSGRPAELSGVEGMVGVFINAVPVRINYEATDKVGPLLERLQSEALDNEQYQFGTLAEIQSQSAHGRQLLDHIMIFENYPLSEAMTESRTGGYAITHVEVFEQTNYDLVVIVVPREDLYVRLDYNSNRYEEHVIQQVMAQLKTLLKDISAKGGDTTLSSLNMVQESDKQLLLEDFNKTAITYPKDKTLIDLFKEQVANNSSKTAITYGEGYEMSYEELDQRSNRIARYLRSQGVGVGDLVGLLLFRGEHLLPCILGVLKSGGAYVPLDPNYPQGRIERIITDSGLKVLIHQGTVAEDLASEELTLLNVDSEGEKVMEQSTEPLNVPLQSSDLAYVIYTSGSTGNPKGVMVAHGNVHNFIVGMREVIPYDQESIMLCLTTISFDIFGLESLLPLMEGASMVLANEQEQNDVGMLLHRIRSSGITTMQLTPSRLELLLSDESAGAFLSGVSSMLVGGEAFPTDLLKKLKEVYQGGIYNMYGPTETTIWSTVKDLSNTDELTIGQPIANTQLYILGEQQELLPIGAEGELWIAGDGLARGYWGNEEMTNSRYVPCPYADGLMYRTGDMAKWLPNGEVAYLGRGDSQVKIRGFRIELGEIESQLRKQDNIKDAVTVIKSRGTDKYLVSYYVSDDELDTKTLRENLLSELPEYMVPYHYIHLEALPLTPNGKLDRRSLPDPDVVASTAYVAPANEVEEQLAEIWSGILNLEKDKISVEANFFELGGHSLKALNLINEVNKHYDIQLTLQYFFEKENIRNLADTIMTIKPVTPDIIDDESIEMTI